MEIARRQHPDHLELIFDGRLDGNWAQHFSTAVAEALRTGAHSVRANLSKTSYISSAGIGVLVEIYKQFQAINGSFVVIEPSPQVRRILEMVGLAPMLLGGMLAGEMPATSPAHSIYPQIERREIEGAAFEIHDYAPGAELTCQLVGQPQRLASADFSADHCRALSMSRNRLALGLGAFGDTFAGCRDHFGEFLGVAGAVACQPTDSAGIPDFMLSSGAFVPCLSTLYGLCCDGDFARLVRFESASGSDPLPLSRIVRACLEIAGAETVGLVILGESAGLMGAALKRSPVPNGCEASRIFAYPEIRRWLSFSPERCFSRALALIAGVASTSTPPDLAPFVRPMTRLSTVAGHFHAAAFGYRPLQKGRVEVRSAVKSLFDVGGLQGVIHLLADDRAISAAGDGPGESELVRGACWLGPVRRVFREDEPRPEEERQ